MFLMILTEGTRCFLDYGFFFFEKEVKKENEGEAHPLIMSLVNEFDSSS